MTTISGFYRCPNPDCDRIHTYSGGFTKVHCACGALINLFDLTYTIPNQ